MKKVISAIIALAMVSFVFANPMVGDNVVFTTDNNPLECTEQECDLDVEDGSGIFMYGMWALKNPQGVVVASQEPELSCTMYSPSTTYKVDKSGTWKFCSQIEAFWMKYENGSCAGDYFGEALGCGEPSMQCMEVQVDSYNCDPKSLQDQLTIRYDNWLSTW
jgi:hypothetical protein